VSSADIVAIVFLTKAQVIEAQQHFCDEFAVCLPHAYQQALHKPYLVITT
jgi:hypothetical protein